MAIFVNSSGVSHSDASSRGSVSNSHVLIVFVNNFIGNKLAEYKWYVNCIEYEIKICHKYLTILV